MAQRIDLREIDTQIQVMKKAAENLKKMAPQFPALEKNLARIRASIKMLEMNVSDVLDLDPTV